MTYTLLAGTRVIESSAFIAAPLCGLTLAQYGADVIRFDLIGGGIDYRRLPVMPGGRSVYWTSLNKGKRSVAIDIRKPEGKELLAALATAPGADTAVLLTNVPSAFLAHGLLSAARPDLISCTIEGNGDGSTAVDYTVHCATGYPMITGTGSRDHPVNQTLPAWDLACAYHAAFAITAAVAQHRVSGHGAELRIALSDIAFTAMSHLGTVTEAALSMPERRAIGNDIYGAFGRDFATQDGRRVMVAAVSARQWQALVTACALTEVIGALERALRVNYAEEEDRFEGREIIADLVARWVGARSFTDVAQGFDEAGVCWGAYQSTSELVHNDARVSTRNPVFNDIETVGIGRHLAAGAAARIIDRPRLPTRPAPLLGEHTDEILREVLHLPDGEIALLHQRGVIAGPDKDPLTPNGRQTSGARESALVT